MPTETTPHDEDLEPAPMALDDNGDGDGDYGDDDPDEEVTADFRARLADRRPQQRHEAAVADELDESFAEVEAERAQEALEKQLDALDWKGRRWKISLKRLKPDRDEYGTSIRGYTKTYDYQVDQDEIRAEFGGGLFEVTIRHGDGTYFRSFPLEIAGPPKPHPDEARKHQRDESNSQLQALIDASNRQVEAAREEARLAREEAKETRREMMQALNSRKESEASSWERWREMEAQRRADDEKRREEAEARRREEEARRQEREEARREREEERRLAEEQRREEQRRADEQRREEAEARRREEEQRRQEREEQRRMEFEARMEAQRLETQKLMLKLGETKTETLAVQLEQIRANAEQQRIADQRYHELQLEHIRAETKGRKSPLAELKETMSLANEAKNLLGGGGDSEGGSMLERLGEKLFDGMDVFTAMAKNRLENPQPQGQLAPGDFVMADPPPEGEPAPGQPVAPDDVYDPQEKVDFSEPKTKEEQTIAALTPIPEMGDPQSILPILVQNIETCLQMDYDEELIYEAAGFTRLPSSVRAFLMAFPVETVKETLMNQLPDGARLKTPRGEELVESFFDRMKGEQQ